MGSGDRLDVDFLAVLAQSAAAARVMGPSAESSPIEPVLELLVVLHLPLFDGHAELLLDSVAIPLWYHVERAEGNNSQVRSEIVDVAAL